MANWLYCCQPPAQALSADGKCEGLGEEKTLHLTCTKLIGVEKAIQILSGFPIAEPLLNPHPFPQASCQSWHTRQSLAQLNRPPPPAHNGDIKGGDTPECHSYMWSSKISAMLIQAVLTLLVYDLWPKSLLDHALCAGQLISCRDVN